MNLFFDTSAIIKRYINENGSQNVDELFSSADQIFVSAISEIESASTLKRLLVENEISEIDYNFLKKEIQIDFTFFSIIDFDSQIIEEAIEAIDKYQLKSLDSIQLASAIICRSDIDNFISCDIKLLKAAEIEKFKIINPNK
ncbi:MAG: type II toxin-antitoxin system VapC family toxin [Spirochaetes bacterium]|nr:type II toxin-antitoxin system VapC family toxin [Spirochaetota bacterium]